MAILALPTLSAASAPQPAPPLLNLPIECQLGVSCEIQHYVDRDGGPGARDYRCGAQTYDGHNGVDLRLPDMAAQRRGVAVLVAADGQVARLRDGVPDISVRHPEAAPARGQECGNGVLIDHGGGWQTQYCHLARGSIRLRPGERVRAGDPVGQVGLSGQTEYPHLHFTVRKDGGVADPFAPRAPAAAGACGAERPLWSGAALRQLSYKPGAVLNAGFASGPVSMAAVESGGVPPPRPEAEVLTAFARAIALQGGDVVLLELSGADGKVLAESRAAPLDRWKAQHLIYVGARRPGDRWPPGLYQARYRVIRGGRVVIARNLQTSL